MIHSTALPVTNWPKIITPASMFARSRIFCPTTWLVFSSTPVPFYVFDQFLLVCLSLQYRRPISFASLGCSCLSADVPEYDLRCLFKMVEVQPAPVRAEFFWLPFILCHFGAERTPAGMLSLRFFACHIAVPSSTRTRTPFSSLLFSSSSPSSTAVLWIPDRSIHEAARSSPLVL